jgi:hypothetical protein
MERPHVVDTARQAALGAAAVVADDVAEQGVLELAARLEFVDQAADADVGVVWKRL